MPAPRRLLAFVAATLAWGIVFFAAWYAGSAPIGAASGWLAARMMEIAAPLDRAMATPRDGTLVIAVIPDPSIRYRDHLRSDAWLEISVNARKHTVALPFFLALVAAARPRRPARIVAAFAALLMMAAAGIACEALLGFSTATTPAGTALFRPGVTAASALALGYQLATLLVPTLMPVALWLWARGLQPRPHLPG